MVLLPPPPTPTPWSEDNSPRPNIPARSASSSTSRIAAPDGASIDSASALNSLPPMPRHRPPSQTSCGTGPPGFRTQRPAPPSAKGAVRWAVCRRTGARWQASLGPIATTAVYAAPPSGSASRARRAVRRSVGAARAGAAPRAARRQTHRWRFGSPDRPGPWGRRARSSLVHHQKAGHQGRMHIALEEVAAGRRRNRKRNTFHVVWASLDGGTGDGWRRWVGALEEAPVVR